MTLIVVTPTLGISRWLHDTVRSVAQCAPDARHILVAPAARIDALRADFRGTEVFPESEGGMYAAINGGVAAAKDDWTAFTYLNDDDVLMPNFEAVMRAVAGAGPSATIGYGRVALIDAAGALLGQIPVSPAPRFNRLLYAQRIEPVFQHGTVVSRAAFEQLKGFDASFRFCGDSEFLARAGVSGVRFVHVSGGPVAAFRLRAGQLTKNRAAMAVERARVDQKLNLIASRRTLRHWWARAVFRLANLSVYAERIRRFGWVSFDEAIQRVD